MKRGKLMMITVAMSVPVAAVCAQVALPCYKTVMRSCAGMWANTTLVCYPLGVATPCGDLIVQDAMVEDVATAKTGQKNPVFTGSTVQVMIHSFGCEAITNICKDYGVNEYECSGRNSSGPNCGLIGPPA